jgi:hypothetical protein
MSTLPLFDAPTATRWRVSAAWATKLHDCTLAGIHARCGGHCCYGPYWPASSYTTDPAGPCGNLGPSGCTLTADVKPVTCHLYPLRLVNGTLGLHFHATRPACCRGNYGRGPMLIDALRQSLVALFGEAAVDRVRADVVAGRDGWFDVPPDVAARMAREQDLATRNERPV